MYDSCEFFGQQATARRSYTRKYVCCDTLRLKRYIEDFASVATACGLHKPLSKQNVTKWVVGCVICVEAHKLKWLIMISNDNLNVYLVDVSTSIFSDYVAAAPCRYL